jgi:hypothetical protein
LTIILPSIARLVSIYDVVWTAIWNHIEDAALFWVTAVTCALLKVIAHKIFLPNAHAILTDVI